MYMKTLYWVKKKVFLHICVLPINTHYFNSIQYYFVIALLLLYKTMLKFDYVSLIM